MINYVRSGAVFRRVRQRLSARARPRRVSVIAAAFATLCALFFLLSATAGDPFRFRGGLRNDPGERRLNAKQLNTALISLRGKAGFLEMCFDEDGFLTLGDQMRFSGGSATARALLVAAVKMPNAVVLKSYSDSSHVAFARLAMPVSYLHYPPGKKGKKIDVFPLEIDFSDLSELRGDKQALAAFDVGFWILHELGHAALGLRDASSDPKGLGECEGLINRIRRELNLPERQTYVAEIYSSQSFTPYRSTRLAELVFARAIEKQGRMQIERFNLRWVASKVGPIANTPFQAVTYSSHNEK